MVFPHLHFHVDISIATPAVVAIFFTDYSIVGTRLVL
jgi:hypothetical protein